MNKIINWFKESNRWKHFLGGFLVGLFSNTTFCAAYITIGVASALEFKDRQWGGSWDWIDWGLTVCGGALGFLTRLSLIALIV